MVPLRRLPARAVRVRKVISGYAVRYWYAIHTRVRARGASTISESLSRRFLIHHDPCSVVYRAGLREVPGPRAARPSPG